MMPTSQRPRTHLATLALTDVGIDPNALAKVEVVCDVRADIAVERLAAADGRIGSRAIWQSASDLAVALHHALLAAALDHTSSDAVLDASAVIASAFLDPLGRLDDSRPGLLVCSASDGAIAVQAPTAAHRAFISSCTRIAGDDWKQSVSKWAPRHCALEAVEELQSWGIPAFVMRGDPVPCEANPAIPVKAGRDVSTSILDAEVIELGGLWAAPYAAQLLRRAGAHVTKIEAPTRPDGARLGSPEHFAALNDGKTELQLDLRMTEDREKLLSLLGSGTIVVENFTGRVLPNLGLDPKLILERGASLVRLPASRAHPDWRGLGSCIEIGAGLGRSTSAGDLTCAPIPMTDALAGMAGALRGVAALRSAPGVHVVGQLEDVATPLARLSRAAADTGHTAIGEPAQERWSIPAPGSRQLTPWEIG